MRAFPLSWPKENCNSRHFCMREDSCHFIFAYYNHSTLNGQTSSYSGSVRAGLFQLRPFPRPPSSSEIHQQMPETQNQLVLRGALQPWPRKGGQEVNHQSSWFPNSVIKLPEACQGRIWPQDGVTGKAVRTETQQAGGVLQPSWVETQGGDLKLWEPNCPSSRGASSSPIVTETSPVEMHSLRWWRCSRSV